MTTTPTPAASRLRAANNVVAWLNEAYAEAASVAVREPVLAAMLAAADEVRSAHAVVEAEDHARLLAAARERLA